MGSKIKPMFYTVFIELSVSEGSWGVWKKNAQKWQKSHVYEIKVI